MFRKALTAMVVLAASVTPALAEWPEKPIKLIVPFGAGGGSDQMARNIQVGIQENDLLPQPLNVVNVTGHFSIGSRQAKDAKADGYTFLQIHMALMGGEGSGAIDFGWRDFEHVAAVGEFCVIPVVRNDLGITTFSELVEKGKAEPGTLLFGANLGAINHMSGVAISEASGKPNFRYVQIGGSTANFTALTGRQIHLTTMGASEILKFHLMPDGSVNPDSPLVPLGYAGPERTSALPDLPTLREQGFEIDFCVSNWIFAPKGTPKEAVEGMADAIEKAAQTEKMSEWLSSRNIANVVRTGDALESYLADVWGVIEPVAKIAAAQK